MARPSSPPRSSPPIYEPFAGPFPTGARPTPRHKLLAARPYVVPAAPPPQFAYVPSKLSYWLNNETGDCVTAEEAFAKACHQPEIFIEDSEVGRWAKSNGFYNGADLEEVIVAMAKAGFQAGSQRYDDGPHQGVDYANETVLQSAISEGPVKIGIDSGALPSGAGTKNGWVALGDGRSHHNEDHCVGLAGYGPASFLAGQLGVPLPSELQPAQPLYLLFTWSTIGFVDHPWIMGTCGEAWVRNPTTVGVPPLPGPTPTPSPTPPSPHPGWWQWIIDLVETMLKHLGLMALPLIESLVSKLPLPEPIIAAIDALIESYLGIPRYLARRHSYGRPVRTS